MKVKIKNIKPDKRFGYGEWQPGVFVAGKFVKSGQVTEIDEKDFNNKIMTKIEGKNE